MPRQASFGIISLADNYVQQVKILQDTPNAWPIPLSWLRIRHAKYEMPHAASFVENRVPSLDKH